MLSPQDITVVLIVAFFVFGGKKLPELGEGLGKGIRAFKDGLNGIEEKETGKQLIEGADQNPAKAANALTAAGNAEVTKPVLEANSRVSEITAPDAASESETKTGDL